MLGFALLLFYIGMCPVAGEIAFTPGAFEDHCHDGRVGSGYFMYFNVVDGASSQDLCGEVKGMFTDVFEVHWFGEGADSGAFAAVA